MAVSIPKWAQDRINKAKEQNRITLNLRWLSWPDGMAKLTSIPDEIFELNQLQSLILSNNEIETIPDEMSSLVNLQTLDISSNRLVDLPEIFTQLSNLEELYLDENLFQEIPDFLEHLAYLRRLHLQGNKLARVSNTLFRLPNLIELDLRNNQLFDLVGNVFQSTSLQTLNLSGNQFTRIPEIVCHFINLQRLYLFNNQISEIPVELSNLKNLKELYLFNNQLTAIPDSLSDLTNLSKVDFSLNRLLTLPAWLVELPRLRRLFVYGNPLESPPPETIELGYGKPVDLDRLRAYFRQLEADGKTKLYEAKLLIVGEPGAGKTTLARKLLNPSAPLPNSNEITEGIDVHIWTFLLQAGYSQPAEDNLSTDQLSTDLGDQKFRVNLWDFGGQQIYHATHQFFLTRRSLYVVVADAREQKEDFFHWLDSIEHLSDASPALILNNEKEDRAWTVNESQLRSHFTNLREGLFAVNLATDRGLERLRQAIQYHITHLPHVGQELPRTWVSVRRALENETRDYVSLDEFLRLCSEHGFSRLEDKLQLSGYLHDLGVILHFQDDPLLKKTVILKPEWATDAVYRLLDSKQVQVNRGQFSRADLGKIWNDDSYILMHDELLALMTKFQLCYEIPTRRGTYIAPQLLSEQPPTYSFVLENGADTDKLLLLRYKYETFMPKGILSRFIVALHESIAEQRLVWRTGVVLEVDGTRAEVVEWYHRHEIYIRVIGAQKRDLLTRIIHEMDKLHHPFHRLKYDKLIPCNCSGCRQAVEPYFYHLDSLKRRIVSQRYDIECDHSFERVDVLSLIDDIGGRQRLLAEDEELLSIDRITLLRQFETAFNDEEVRTLCFKLDVDYEDLSAHGRNNKMRELVTYLDRRDRLSDLIELLKEERPNFRW